MSSQIYDEKIPQGWEVKKISDFTDCTAGGTPNTQISAYWGGKIPWMSSGELHNKQIYDVAERITQAGLENSSTKFIPKNSVLIGLAGQGKTRGTVAISKISLCTNQSIAAIFPNNNFCPEFLLYNLENRYDELRSLSAGDGGRGGLNLHIIKNIEILFPPKVEQERIAQVLGNMDDLISAKYELLDKKRAIEQAAAQQLLTPKPHWHTATLGEIFTFLKGKGLSKEKLISNGKFKCILYGELYTTYNEVIDSIESSTNCEEGIKSKFDDLLIPASTTTSAIDLAKASVVLQCEILIGGDINILRKKRNDVSGKFMAYYLTSTKKIEIAQYAQGITIIHLYAKNLSDLEISYPSLLEQTKIAEILSDMDDEISALQDEIEKLKMIKQGAMDELLSGKIRLKG